MSTEGESNVEILGEDDAISEAFVKAPVPSTITTLGDAESFISPQDRLKQMPKVTVEFGEFTFRAASAARAAFWTLALTLLLGFTLSQTSSFTTNRNRRKRKTELCVKKCLEIVADAAKDIEFIHFRALESEDKTRSRKERKYKTRR